MLSLSGFAEEVEDRFADSLLHRANATIPAVFELRSAQTSADNAQADGIPASSRLAPDVLIALGAFPSRLLLFGSRFDPSLVPLFAARGAAAFFEILRPLVPEIGVGAPLRVVVSRGVVGILGLLPWFAIALVNIRARNVGRDRLLFRTVVQAADILVSNLMEL